MGMRKREQQRLGLFVYEWAMYSLMKDFAVKLAESGYLVDIFYKAMPAPIELADVHALYSHQNIRYFDSTEPQTWSGNLARRARILLNRAAITLRIPRNYRPECIVDHKTLAQSRRIVGSARYSCLIGIEKKGLVWAGLLAEAFACPLMYYSLELYTEDNPEIDRYYHVRNAEKKYHRICCATIIQDEPRAQALFESNAAEGGDTILLPVAVRGSRIHGKSDFLRRRCNIPRSKKILLYYGFLHERRLITQLVQAANGFGDDFILALHGWGSGKYLDYLRSISDRTKVAFSLDAVPEQDIVDLIASADIGLALYATTNSNDRLVAFSSTKMAYYAQCGVPVIAFDTPSFRQLLGAHSCGELITSMEEIPHKAHKILRGYNSYRRKAYLAFRRFYDLDANFERFLPRFKEVLSRLDETRTHVERHAGT